MNTVERDLLEQLAAMPLLDRVELAAVTGRSASAVYEGIDSLVDEHLVARLPHASELVAPTQRFRLTASGLDRLADLSGTATAALLREHPASEEWLRLLMRRLDGVAMIYRLAAALCEEWFPIRFRWYRSAPADAAIALPDGRTLAIVRCGRTADRTAFARRIGRLRDGPAFSAALLVLPDEVRLRHARRLVAPLPFTCFLALESHAATASTESRVWRAPSGASVMSLATALGLVSGRGSWGREPARQRRSLPGSTEIDADDADWRLSSRLKPAEKRTVDLLADWPWLAPDDLTHLLGVGRRRVSALTTELQRCGLVITPRLGGRRRLALTDRALTWLAHRDRTSPADARRRWSASPLDEDEPLEWRNVSGARTRQLLRHLDHTEAVHGFAARLVSQARSMDWDVAQLDPPQRASRYFRHRDRLHSIQPDAFGLLRGPERYHPFFLEWERRAIRPKTMATRLAPYLRYFAGSRPLDDHGAVPRLLVVFEQDLPASRFMTVARGEMERTDVQIPLFVSDRERIESAGPLGTVWLSGSDWQRHDAFSNR
ncbi:MAG: hypothetical protein OXH13_04380 [Chloroflexi bacterium]|nr:hypothetical protein [Chloroflexota bacterium]MCY3696049.1 hypothetical protein [Chloroflexota bacterium]